MDALVPELQDPAEQSTPGSAARAAGGSEGPAVPVHLGRTPVYDAGLRVVGYQLVFAGSSGADISETDRARAMAELFAETPPTVLSSGGLTLVRLPRPCLIGELPIPTTTGEADGAGAARVVLEVDDRLLLGSDATQVAQRLAHLAATGHCLGLVVSSVPLDPALDALLPLFSLARADISRIGTIGIEALAARLIDGPTELLVEGVETLGQLDACRRHHVPLLGGGLVSRPPIVADRALDPSQLACLRLMTALVRPEVDLGEVELAVRSDPALTMRVLKTVNSAAGARRRVSSIRQAVVLLGPRALLGCVLSAGLSQGGTVCAPEAVEQVLVRARMCELLAAAADGTGGESLDGSAAFTVGLVSSLDTLLGASLREIVGELPVDEVVERAVLHCAGPLGRVLADVVAYEQRAPSQLLDVDGLRTLFVAALRWATPLTLGSPG